MLTLPQEALRIPVPRRIVVGSCLAVLASCSPGKNFQPLPDYQAQAYRLGVGDQLRVITFGEDQLTGEFRVDDQGRVAIPLLGGVQAAGLTPQLLEQKIEGDLKTRDFLRNPHVTVEVIAYRPIFVLGEVNKPGQYPYQPGMTLLTSVAVAGGFTYRAVQDVAGVVRTTSGVVKEGLVVPSSFLAPGDVVKVFERVF